MRARKRRLLAMLRAYRAAAAALPDAVVVIERNRQRVLWFNEAATPLLGLRHPQHVEASVVDALQPVADGLVAGRRPQCRADDGRALAGRSGTAPEPAPDPVFG